MKIIRITALAVAALLSIGCVAGPNHRRPKADVPDAYRGAAPGSQTVPQSLGDQKWPEVFADEQLQKLIRTALEQNFDVRIAAARILQAQAQLGVTRSAQFPELSGGAAANNERVRFLPGRPPTDFTPQQANLSFSWELDFWGKSRRGTEAASASLRGAEWGRQAVMTTLVANVSGAYFQLRELDLELEISKRTLESRQESLRLINAQERLGATSLLEVRQAEQLVFTAAETIPDLERRIEQGENFISILMGQNPASVPRGRKLTDQPQAATVPAGLPSA